MSLEESGPRSQPFLSDKDSTKHETSSIEVKQLDSQTKRGITQASSGEEAYLRRMRMSSAQQKPT